MKYPKILSIPLTNAFGLLVFGSILAGCQKTAIHKKGLFSQIGIDQGRTPASVVEDFSGWQDPKQIYIHCRLNDVNPKNCYSRHLKEALREFARKRRLDKDALANIKTKHPFEEIKAQTDEVTKKVFMVIQPRINRLVEKRVAFCKANSKLYPGRCLKQYLNKETFQVLNDYQESNRSMNGHEYLYLKARIEDNFKKKLESARSFLEEDQKKKS